MVQQHIRLGDLLVGAGLLSEENLRYVLEEQRGTNKRLGQLLVDKGFLAEEELMQFLARQFDLEILKPDALDDIESRPLQLVPEILARHHTVLPLQCEGQTLYVVTADPLNVEAVNDLQHATGLRIRWRLAPASMIQKAIERLPSPQCAIDEQVLAHIRVPGARPLPHDRTLHSSPPQR